MINIVYVTYNSMISLGAIAYLISLKYKKAEFEKLKAIAGIFILISIISTFNILEQVIPNNWLIHGSRSITTGEFLINLSHPSIIADIALLLYVNRIANAITKETQTNNKIITLSFILTLITGLTTLLLFTGIEVKTADIILITHQDSVLAKFIFDILQLMVISSIVITYYSIKKFTHDKKNINCWKIILITATISLIASVIEILAHFWNALEIDQLLFTIPLITATAIIYYKNPELIYFTPAKITFIQILKEDGNYLYLSKGNVKRKISEYLIGPSLVAMNVLLKEIVSKKEKDDKVEKIIYNHGIIIFNYLNNVQAIIHTDNPTFILKKALKRLPKRLCNSL